jgi:hypothetical protein
MSEFTIFNIFMIWLVSVALIGSGLVLMGGDKKRIAGMLLILTVPYLFCFFILDAMGVIRVHWGLYILKGAYG